MRKRGAEKMRYRKSRGVPDVKSSQTNLKTRSGLGGISTGETGIENALRGANDVPAAARKRSKLRPAAAQYRGRSDTNTLIDILSSFLQILQIFFQRFTQISDKITVEVCSNFYSGLFKNFLASFPSVF